MRAKFLSGIEQGAMIQARFKSFTAGPVNSRSQTLGLGLIMGVLGFSSGLPLLLLGSTLQARFTQAGMSLAGLGALSLLGLPYAYKFAWAPLFDAMRLPWLGRRLGWVTLFQVILVIIILGLAELSPVRHMGWVLGLAVLAVFCSASQDCVVDAYRTDILSPEQRGLGIAMNQFGYRLAMLASGGGALLLADHYGWVWTYRWMAGGLLTCVLFTCFAPPTPDIHLPLSSWRSVVVAPWRAIWQRSAVLPMLVFMVLYKCGEAFAMVMMTPFILRGLHFSLAEVGLVYKGYGVLAALLGALVGGWFLPKLGLKRALLWFGWLQALANLGFVLLAHAGHHFYGLVAAVGAESLTAGMASTAFVAFLMQACDAKFSGAQYALFSSLAALARVLLGPLAGGVASHLSWSAYFMLAFILCMPGLVLLLRLSEACFESDNEY